MAGFFIKIRNDMISTVNEIQLSYRPNRLFTERAQIIKSSDAYKILEKVFDQDMISLREEFVVIYLNRNNDVLGYFKAFTGGVSSVVCDIKIILGIALKSVASGIILAHNHPSGKLKPSDQDSLMTKKVQEACKKLEVDLIDHLILVPQGGYLSFADEGLMY